MRMNSHEHVICAYDRIVRLLVTLETLSKLECSELSGLLSGAIKEDEELAECFAHMKLIVERCQAEAVT